MKKEVREVIVFALLLALAVSAASCDSLGNDGKDTKPADTTTQSAQDTTTSPTSPASADPAEMTSRGLVYLSCGNRCCVLTGIGECEDNCVIIPEFSEDGEQVVGIARDAFSGCDKVNAVSIPAGVVNIEDGAFAGCRGLAYISVAEGNNAYKDIGGILYNSDCSTLVCVPAGGTYTTLTVTLQTKNIAPRATAGCSHITKLLFEGNEKEWKAIVVGAGNDLFDSLTPVYMKQTGK